jgi:hypothetical protein
LERGRRLGKAERCLPPLAIFVQQPTQRRFTRCGNGVLCNPAGFQAGNPILYRKGLSGLSVHDGSAGLFASRAGSQHYGLVEVAGHGQHCIGFTQAAQDAAGLTGDRAFIVERGPERGCHGHWLLCQRVCVVTRPGHLAEQGQGFIQKRIVAACLDSAHTAADGRRRLTRRPRDVTQRLARRRMGEILPRRHRQPAGQNERQSGMIRYGAALIGRGRCHGLTSLRFG